MQEEFAPEIDKINAPHQNAHWCWDTVKAKEAYEYVAKIFGSPGLRMSMSQWFSMMMQYDLHIEPFVEITRLSRDQVRDWVKVSREALQARTWANSNCTPEMIRECDRKIRESRDAMKKTPEKRVEFMNMMAATFSKYLKDNQNSLGWEEFFKM